MMKILIVAATQFEISATIKHVLDVTKNKEDELTNLEVSFILTGVGMVNTAFTLGKLHAIAFDLVINAGIAGSFSNHAAGTVVNVTEDCFSELGAEDGENFLSIDEMGFGTQHVKLVKAFHHPLTGQLPLAKGITVNTVHGNDRSIALVKQRYDPAVETMEGAAFIQAANTLKWNAIQLRAISNQVEKRNKGNWNMPLAIKNLNEYLIRLLKNLNQQSVS